MRSHYQQVLVRNWLARGVQGLPAGPVALVCAAQRQVVHLSGVRATYVLHGFLPVQENVIINDYRACKFRRRRWYL